MNNWRETFIRLSSDRPCQTTLKTTCYLQSNGTPLPTSTPSAPVRAPVRPRAAERGTTPLSDQEIREATSCRIAFGRDDLAFIDWNAALVFGQDMDDVRAVLEFVNGIAEMRTLDQQLDRAMDEGYEALRYRPAENSGCRARTNEP